MMRYMGSIFGSCLVVCLVAGTGCKSHEYTSTDTNLQYPRTEGERMLYRAQQMKVKGDMMVQAEKMMADGQATRERGQTLIDQGKTVSGERISAEGDVKIREAQAMMTRAQEMPVAPPATQPAVSMKSES